MKHSPAFLKLVQDTKKNITEVTIQAIADRLKSGDTFHLVDTREDGEWQNGHITGAIHLGKGIIERDIENTIPDKQADIVLYCGGWFSFRLGGEIASKDGIYQCEVHGWGDAWVA